MEVTRVFLVDDHAIFRAGLRALLELYPDLEVVGEASDGEEAIRKVQEIRPDIILMDIALPGMDGLTAAREILNLLPTCRILLLSQYENREYVLPGLRLGAAGYILKRSAADQLLQAIRTVKAGRSYIDSAVTDLVVEGFRQKGNLAATDGFETLTEREREVLVLLAKGYKIRKIASILNLSPKTVDFHRANIMNKLDLKNRAELTQYALRRGLLD
ncbi:MAG: response regulator transcription factor [Firmicutes bacterium]|nr:response regulator transcription factor [Bacillota bacterium]MCL5039551.1 response regulator transcription factor [Bacillota bacterium]